MIVEKHRYTLQNDSELEEFLAQSCQSLADEIANIPVINERTTILLGGGYGRGEGGTFIQNGKKKPYNDLDLFVFCHHVSSSQKQKIDAALLELSQKWHAKLEIDVDFAPAREVRTLYSQAYTTMYQELLYGSLLLYGDEALWQCYLPEVPAGQMPYSEGVRLLLNRGTGILLARERFKKSPLSDDDKSFIWRNLYKSALGSGDAVLIFENRYRYGLNSRYKILKERLKPEFLSLYECAMKFKSRPSIPRAMINADDFKKFEQMWLKSYDVAIKKMISERPSLTQQCKNFLKNLRYAPKKSLTFKELFLPPQCWLLLETYKLLINKNISNWYIAMWKRFN